MKLLHWTRFTWDLAKLPASPDVSMDPRYTIRPASREDEKTVRNVVLSSFKLDSAWADTVKSMQDWLDAHIDEAFSHRRQVLCLVVTHGSRIIGASLMNADPEAETHLVTGPCILIEYRNRGIGSVLLYESLCALRDAGLGQARGLTKNNVAAAKFVYPKFQSSSEEIDFTPQMVGS